MTVTLAEWREREREIEADAVLDGGSPLLDLPLLDLLPLEFLAELTPMQALALRHDPRVWLRPAQLPPTDNDWLVWLQMQGRGAGKSTSAAGWVVSQILEGHPSRPADYVLVAPKLDDCWTLQWRTIKAHLPPWVRHVERVARNSVLFPDHGVELFMHGLRPARATNAPLQRERRGETPAVLTAFSLPWIDRTPSTAARHRRRVRVYPGLHGRGRRARPDW
jgi:hypothetical protein